MRIRYAAACLAACAALSLGGARAEWYVFEADNPPEALLDAAMQVSGFTGEVTLSFLGDCTLGGESKAANSRGGFVQTALREGYDYPFLNLQSLLGRRRRHRGESGGRSDRPHAGSGEKDL